MHIRSGAELKFNERRHIMEGKVEVVETNEQPVLSIKMITSVDELPMVIGEAYGKIYR